MSGWMKYPYKECQDCDEFDWDNAHDIVNHPDQACSYNDFCPMNKDELLAEGGE